MGTRLLVVSMHCGLIAQDAPKDTNLFVGDSNYVSTETFPQLKKLEFSVVVYY